MKHTIISLVCIALCSCFNELRTNTDTVRSFIPGIYIMNYQNEYSKGKDTLTITLLSKEGNNYRIERSTTYQRIKNGKPLELENKKEQWICIYSEQDKVLHEIREGRIISFIPEKKELLVGNSEYRKVDEYGKRNL